MPPNLVILHGEDELAISQRLSDLLAALGDSAAVEIGATKLDGRTASMAELETAVSTLPFLLPRRVVVLTHPLARLASTANKDKFRPLLDKVPPPVTLVLVEYKTLVDERDRKKPHWLETWAKQAGERVEIKNYPLPRSGEMPARIQAIAKGLQGQIAPQAAYQLATLVGESPRLADQELQKLLAYVNYSRPIQAEDVQHLIEDQAQGNIFALVDALGNSQAKQAANNLHRLLEQEDAISIFAMIVRQFRILLLAREVLDNRGQIREIPDLSRAPQFVIDKDIAQARRFSMERLEAIYHRLLEIDAAVKTGEVEIELALDAFIAEIAL